MTLHWAMIHVKAFRNSEDKKKILTIILTPVGGCLLMWKRKTPPMMYNSVRFRLDSNLAQRNQLFSGSTEKWFIWYDILGGFMLEQAIKLLLGRKVNILWVQGNCLIQIHPTTKKFLTKFYLIIIIFWPCHVACRILVPRPRIKSMAPAVEAESPNHWPSREFPSFNKCSLNTALCQFWCRGLGMERWAR